MMYHRTVILSAPLVILSRAPAHPRGQMKDLLFAFALIAIAACQEPRVARQTTPDVPAYQAAFVVSDTAPAVGDTVRVALMLRLGPDTAVASFTGRIAYDTSGLAFAGDASPNDGTMRAHNPEGAVLRIAGASVDGIASGELFRATFIVRQRGALATLRASFDEVHDVSTRDVRTSVRTAASVLLAEAGR